MMDNIFKGGIKMVESIVGVVCILLSMFQFYATYKNFTEVKNNGNKNTSYFIGFSIWYSLFFGIILLGVGISLVFHPF